MSHLLNNCKTHVKLKSNNIPLDQKTPGSEKSPIRYRLCSRSIPSVPIVHSVGNLVVDSTTTSGSEIASSLSRCSHQSAVATPPIQT